VELGKGDQEMYGSVWLVTAIGASYMGRCCWRVPAVRWNVRWVTETGVLILDDTGVISNFFVVDALECQ
jgi:hypothetical protein